METYNFFLNKYGRLRSGWRVGIFIVAFAVVAKLTETVFVTAIALAFKSAGEEALKGYTGFFVQSLVLFTAAAIVGWACGGLLEELPWRALGWATHKGWFRDFLLGSVIGSLSLGLAAASGAFARGFHFNFEPSTTAPAIAKTLVLSALLFVIAASAEEVLFRGYPLQTLTRARLAWLGVFLTSVPFAAAHLYNPHVVRGVTFVNTALAGVWLAIAYLRTRSLWLPLGLHWSWNWTMGSVLGLPVSGINSLAPAPLLHATDAGPAWLTGGAYGPEGGAVCTLALLISIVFVWRIRWLSATEEMKRLTDEEQTQSSHVHQPQPDGSGQDGLERPS
ncbi:MAG: type II CAAX endopeptidase family protein [Pyrinomonadaceae bacterium]